MEQEFAGKVAVVTGAASGIGYAVAEHLAQWGAHVVGVDRSGTVTDRMARLPGDSHHGIVVDLTDPAAAQQVISSVIASVGPRPSSSIRPG